MARIGVEAELKTAHQLLGQTLAETSLLLYTKNTVFHFSLRCQTRGLFGVGIVSSRSFEQKEKSFYFMFFISFHPVYSSHNSKIDDAHTHTHTHKQEQQKKSSL